MAVCDGTMTLRAVIVEEFRPGLRGIRSIRERILIGNRPRAAGGHNEDKDQNHALHRIRPSYETPNRMNERLLSLVRPQEGLKRKVTPLGRLHAMAGAM